MKILYLHQYFSTPSGKTGTRSYEFARRLVERGHEVTILCSSYRHADTGLGDLPFSFGRRVGSVEGISVVEFNLPHSNYFGFLMRALVFALYVLGATFCCLFRSYDLVFATSTPLTVAIPAIIAKLLRRKPFVFEVRDLWPEAPRAVGAIRSPVLLYFLTLLEEIAYRKSDFRIGLSPGIVDRIEEVVGKANGVCMIPNSCDRELFESQSPKALPIEREEGDFLALFCGAHGLANGLYAVLDAAEELLSMGRRDVKLVFLGDGSQKPALAADADRRGLSNCIFLDPLPKEILAKSLASADLALMIFDDISVFYYGTSPNKFFDYLSCGLPVLVNYPGWVADLVGEHKCGVAVSPGDPGGFARALVSFADLDGESRMRMRENALALSENFARDKLAEDFIACLESVLPREGLP